MKRNISSFSDRRGRAQFIARTFEDIIQKSESVLDIGSSDNDLKKIVGSKVHGIDIDGNPDQKIDLEKESLSSFENSSFELSVCTEVLEHIDNFHEVLDDIMRVSKNNVIISLPNCSDIWKILRLLFIQKAGKFYGLPLERPLDRHKWFFSWKDLDIFFTQYTKKNGYFIEQKFLHYNYSRSAKGLIIRAFLFFFPFNLFAHSYWIVIRKSKALKN